jgi:hypothetical protein
VLSEAGGGPISGDVLDNSSAPLGNASLLSAPLDTLTAQSSDETSLGENLADSAVSNVTSLNEQLGASGYLSFGSTIDLIATPAPPTNELFTGASYTDYNMALQSHLSTIGTAAVAPITEPTDTATLSPTVDLPPPGNEQSALLKPIQDATTSVVQTQTATGDLIGHTHL